MTLCEKLSEEKLAALAKRHGPAGGGCEFPSPRSGHDPAARSMPRAFSAPAARKQRTCAPLPSHKVFYSTLCRSRRIELVFTLVRLVSLRHLLFGLLPLLHAATHLLVALLHPSVHPYPLLDHGR